MARYRNTMSDEDIDALNAAQVEFSLNPRFVAPQITHFMQAQERIFEQVEKFSSAWFRRRQDAAQSMIDIGKQLASEGRSDPAIAMKAFTEWQIGSMERIAEDAKDCTELLSGCAGALVAGGGEADAEAAE